MSEDIAKLIDWLDKGASECGGHDATRLRSAAAELESLQRESKRWECAAYGATEAREQAEAERDALKAANERLTEALRGAEGVLVDAAQFMDGVKHDAVNEGWWSEWDQELRGRISAALSSTTAPDTRTCATCDYHDKRDEPEEGCFFDGKLCHDHSGWTPRKDAQQGDRRE